MNPNDYLQNVKKTESIDFDKISARMTSTRNIRLLHAAMGLSTEAGELLDALKKHIFYGKALDQTNLFEEVGDLLWYMAIMADELGFSFEKAMEKNIEKLKARYGDKFSESAALHRNLAKETQILESGL